MASDRPNRALLVLLLFSLALALVVLVRVRDRSCIQGARERGGREAARQGKAEMSEALLGTSWEAALESPDVIFEVAGQRYRVARDDLDARGIHAISEELFLDRLRGLIAEGDPEPEVCLVLARWVEKRGHPSLYGLALRWVLFVEPDHDEARRRLEALRASLRALPPRPEADARILRELEKDVPGGEFHLHHTPHFRIAYQTSEAFARHTGELLERVHRAFVQFFESRHFEPIPSADRLEVVLFGSQNAYRRFVQPFGPAFQGTAGLYSTRHHRSFFYNALSDPLRETVQGEVFEARRSLDALERDLLGEAEPYDAFRLSVGGAPPQELDAVGVRAALAKERQRLGRTAREVERHFEGLNVARAVHEITHHLAFASGIHSQYTENPRWLVEGLAMFFEPTVGSEWRRPGGLPLARLGRVQKRFRQGTWVSMSRLVLSDAPFEEGGPVTAEAYDAAWALFTFLVKTRHDALFDYLANLSLRVSRETAGGRLGDLQRAFGPLPPLEREWRRLIEDLTP